MKQQYFILILLIVVCSCTGQNEELTSQKKVPPVSHKKVKVRRDAATPAVTYEDFLSDTIFSLAEVRAKDRYLDSLTNHEHGISFMVDNDGGRSSETAVIVGYNGEERFETYYVFYVDNVTKTITVADSLSNKRLTLEEWRKAR